jgi:putative DNA methylase
MGDMRPNQARVKRVSEFAGRDLTEATELGRSRLGRLILGLQQMLRETEARVVVEQFKREMDDFLDVRLLLAEVSAFLARKSPEQPVREAAEVLAARLKNLRFGE